jgi:poly-gamma-glutamate capsule biosynthesis protein CapA/YwtB (metallophosphatase superfamily)
MGAAAGALALPPLTPFSTAAAQTPGIDWAARVSALPGPGAGEVVITAVGDLMLSRPEATRPGAHVQEMYRVMREADIGFGNCEQAIASVGFYAQRMAYPPMLDDFKAAGLTALGLANNHFMDMGPVPALQGIGEMKSRGFQFAGCGRNLDDALAPGIRVVKGVRVGLMSFWCSAATFAPPAYMEQARAGAGKPGMAMIVGQQVRVPGSDVPVLMPVAADIRMLAESVKRARSEVDFLMVSFHQHWGGQEGTGQGIIPPQPPARRTAIIPADLTAARNHINDGRKLICRAAIDAGADLIIGHGNHVLNGIEIYKGKPILYSLGHFYIEGMKNGKALPQFFFSPTMVAQIENGWWQEEQRWSAIARLFVKNGRVTRLDLLPVTIDIQKDGLPSFADDALARRIAGVVQTLSKPLGTNVTVQGWYAQVAGLGS